MVPLCCEALKKFGNYNPSTVFGITALDTVRANTVVANSLKIEPEKVMVPVIGGYSEETRVPVLSQVHPTIQFSDVRRKVLLYNCNAQRSQILIID
nr:unnamed protein product [Callosobruchus chinensis]